MYPNAPNKKILHPELSYKLTGLMFKAHKDLGRFCREKQYGDYFETLLKENGISYKREYEINKLKPSSPKGNRGDFIIKGLVIIEFKAKPFVVIEDCIQMQRYLQGSGIELGIIVNFRTKYLKPKRVLNHKLYRVKNSDNSDINSDNSD